MATTRSEPPMCASPISDETLLEYWMAALDETAEAVVEEHLSGATPAVVGCAARSRLPRHCAMWRAPDPFG